MEKTTKNYIFAGISKRIYTFLFDALMVFILAFVLNLAFAPVLQSLPVYSEKNALVNQKVNELYNIEEEAKLIDFENLSGEKQDTPIDMPQMFQKYIYQQVALSYQKDSDGDFKNNNIVIEEYKYGVASKENDALAYLYTTFIPNHPNQGMIDLNKDPISYYVDEILLKTINDKTLFIVDDGYPYLNSKVGVSLYNHVFEDNLESKEGRANLGILQTYFHDVMDSSFKILKDYIPFKDNFLLYYNNYNILITYNTSFQTIVFVSTFLILMIILPLCLKGKTLGNLVFKTVFFDSNDEKASLLKTTLKKMPDFVLMFWVNFLVCVLTTGASSLTATLFSIGNFNVTLFSFISLSFILMIVDVIVGAIKQDKRTLSEVICGVTMKVREKDYIN